MRFHGFFSLLLGLTIVLYSCNQEGGHSSDTDIAKIDFESKFAEVSTIPLARSDFTKELRSNGVLTAKRKANLNFKIKATIQKIHVRNGTRVRKGQLLAELDDFELRNQMENSRIVYARSLVDLQDELLQFGGRLSDTAKIDDAKLKYLKIKSGYEQAKLALKEAKYLFKNAKLYAPFSGIIANLNSKIYNPSKSGEVFCSVIDDSFFEVNFSILETENSMIGMEEKVKVQLFSENKSFYHGNISEINPIVNEHGLIEVRAIIRNRDSSLLDGMNVKVIIERVVPDQLRIPKEALLLRDGREVVFTYKKEDSTAYWNYVKSGMENTTSYTVLEGLKPGDEIIVGGNLNLAHESKVIVISN